MRKESTHEENDRTPDEPANTQVRPGRVCLYREKKLGISVYCLPVDQYNILLLIY